MRREWTILSLTLLAIVFAPMVRAQDRIILQSTTSTQNSGLLDAVLPAFTRATGYPVHVVAVGTGQALQNARNGDGDVVLVHARDLEEAFVAEGGGVERFDLMFNDFVIVGPGSDPAGIAGANSTAEALARIAANGARFTSRGDGSGTHRKELSLWPAAGVDVAPASGDWYRETGAGMGTTLNIAIEMEAYVLTDRGTWISFGRKNGHKVLFEGQKDLFNPYGIIAVNPARFPHVNAKGAEALISWLLGPDGQAAIAGYTLGGEQLFFPNAKARPE